MIVSRSGYYKWLGRLGTKNRYQLNRDHIKTLIKEIHQKYPTSGYRSIAAHIRNDYGWIVSDYYVHLNCKEMGIQSVVRRKRYKQLPGDKHHIYRNLVGKHWNSKGPFEILCTDTTFIKHRGILYDLTLYIDTFNNEIISYSLSTGKYGADPKSHHEALMMAIREKNKRGYINLETIIHSDQGVIYASQAFNYAHKDYNIKWSMSRAGTPTDNPIIESLNGWIKEELRYQFKIDECRDIQNLIEAYVYYYNNERYMHSLGYKNPIQYKTELGYK